MWERNEPHLPWLVRVMLVQALPKVSSVRFLYHKERNMAKYVSRLLDTGMLFIGHTCKVSRGFNYFSYVAGKLGFF